MWKRESILRKGIIMKDQILIDKYNELGKAHAEAMNQLAKKDEIIKELRDFNHKFIKIMNATSMSFSSFEVLELVNEVKKKVEELS